MVLSSLSSQWMEFQRHSKTQLTWRREVWEWDPVRESKQTISQSVGGVCERTTTMVSSSTSFSLLSLFSLLSPSLSKSTPMEHVYQKGSPFLGANPTWMISCILINAKTKTVLTDNTLTVSSCSRLCIWEGRPRLARGYFSQLVKKLLN